MKDRRRCEAPDHSPDCNGFGDTRDHFTPRCIARELGWSQQQVNDPMNIQYLSPACHKEKDKTTPERLDQLRRQREGEYFGIPGVTKP